MKQFSKKVRDIHKREMKNVVDYKSVSVIDIYGSREAMFSKYSFIAEEEAYKFDLRELYSGILSFNDLIQEGYIGLLEGIDKVDIEMIPKDSDNPDKSVEHYLRDRVWGSIRRALDKHRSSIRMSDRKLTEMRKSRNPELVSSFIRTCLISLDDNKSNLDVTNCDVNHSIQKKVDEYDYSILSKYIDGVLRSNLSKGDYELITDVYGLGKARKHKITVADGNGVHLRTVYRKIDGIIDSLADKLDSNLVIDFLR